jgi:hypothetical protein
MNQHSARVRYLLSFLSALILLAAAPLFAGGSAEPEPSITVIGVGEVFAEPDQATMSLGVQLFDRSAQAATESLRRRMSAVVEAIRAEGVPNDQIQTTNYSIFFERDYQTPLREQSETDPPAGIYRVENTVQVTISDVDRAAAVVEAAIEAGANQMYGIHFWFSDPAAIDSQARNRAMADARSRAEELASAAGLELGEALQISELATGGPVQYGPHGEALGRGGLPVIEPGQSRYTTRVEVRYELGD